jgi:preprotein translocase subunit SecG
MILLKLIQCTTGIFLILVVAGQTPKDNIVLSLFHNSGYFINFAEAKAAVKIVTWVPIFIFLLCTLLLNIL